MRSAAFAAVCAVLSARAAFCAAPGFPEPSMLEKPWGICYLPGSAADKAGFAAEIKRWKHGGLGGVRIIPIYRAKGWEGESKKFLSPEFMEMLADAKAVAAAEDFGIDTGFGAGWCFGGAHIPPECGVRTLQTLRSGDTLPAGAETLFEGEGVRLVAVPTGQAVKRAQPCDSGPMLDPFSPAAMRAHIAAMSAFDKYPGSLPRATFHDSFEYFNAAWSPEFPELFAKYRGYKIEDHYAGLAGIGDRETVARVKCDYRETLSDILVKETFPMWTGWCRERGIGTHNQAHGAPANLLEFYAIADTPETEMFGRGARDRFASRFDSRFREGDRSILMAKFASSAAHLAGRRHTSAESFTWLAEHFCETPEEMKAEGDLFFLSGVDRLYWHATVYSPDSAPWPGWCFYASSELNPRNPLWRDIGALSGYFARVQSLLAEAKPDNDVLLYWPVHDLWTKPDGFAELLSVHSHWLEKTAFGDLAKRLAEAGYSFDYVSDSFLTDETASRYKAIVVPETKYMKRAAFERLVALSRKMDVVFEKALPQSEPGLGGRELVPGASAPAPVPDAVAALGGTGAKRDAFAASDTPFDTLRTEWNGKKLYFVVNSSMAPAAIIAPKGATLMDPRKGTSGELENDMALTMHPAQSLFFLVDGAELAYDPSVAPVEPEIDTGMFAGGWTLEFKKDVSGAPVPPRREGVAPGDWTALGDAEAAFSGTAEYSVSFDFGECDPLAVYSIDLGEVRETARVSLNGTDLGVLYMRPYATLVPPGLLKEKGNRLVVEVANLAANRIRDCDRRRVSWKIFEDANMCAIDYRPLDASGWPVMPSGLIGPVGIGRFGARRDAEEVSSKKER